jgi:hypothetical protein
VHKQIQIIADVQMAELKGTAERDDERCVKCALGAERAFLGAFVRNAVFALEDAGRQRFRGDSAREWGIVVDVEFE